MYKVTDNHIFRKKRKDLINVTLPFALTWAINHKNYEQYLKKLTFIIEKFMKLREYEKKPIYLNTSYSLAEISTTGKL